jgi:lysozyme
MADYDVAMADALIAGMEGCVLVPSQDPVGNWSIGYGCDFLADGSPVGPYTAPLANVDAATDLLTAKLAGTVEEVRDMVHVRDLPLYSFAALYSFAYNVGCVALMNSTLMHMLNSGATIDDVAVQFSRWVYATDRKTHRLVTLPGLVRRRAAEAACFTGRELPLAPPGAPPSPLTRPIPAAVQAAPETADDLNAAELTQLGA